MTVQEILASVLFYGRCGLWRHLSLLSEQGLRTYPDHPSLIVWKAAGLILAGENQQGMRLITRLVDNSSVSLSVAVLRHFGATPRPLTPPTPPPTAPAAADAAAAVILSTLLSGGAAGRALLCTLPAHVTTHPTVAAARALALLADGEVTAAAGAVSGALRETPDDPVVHAVNVAVLTARGEVQKAAAAARAAAAAAGDCQALEVPWMMAEFEAGNGAAAAAVAEKIVQRAPNDVLANLILALGLSTDSAAPLTTMVNALAKFECGPSAPSIIAATLLQYACGDETLLAPAAQLAAAAIAASAGRAEANGAGIEPRTLCAAVAAARGRYSEVRSILDAPEGSHSVHVPPPTLMPPMLRPGACAASAAAIAATALAAGRAAGASLAVLADATSANTAASATALANELRTAATAPAPAAAATATTASATKASTYDDEGSDDDLAAIAAEFGFDASVVSSSVSKQRTAAAAAAAAAAEGLPKKVEPALRYWGTVCRLHRADPANVQLPDADLAAAATLAGAAALWASSVGQMTGWLVDNICTIVACALDRHPAACVTDKAENNVAPSAPAAAAADAVGSLESVTLPVSLPLVTLHGLRVRAGLVGLGDLTAVRLLTDLTEGSDTARPATLPASIYAVLAAAAAAAGDAAAAGRWCNVAFTSDISVRAMLPYQSAALAVGLATGSGAAQLVVDIQGSHPLPTGPGAAASPAPDTPAHAAEVKSACLRTLRGAVCPPSGVTPDPALITAASNIDVSVLDSAVTAAKIMAESSDMPDGLLPLRKRVMAVLEVAATRAGAQASAAAAALVALAASAGVEASAAIIAAQAPTRANLVLIAMSHLAHGALAAAATALASALAAPCETPVAATVPGELVGLAGDLSDAAVLIRAGIVQARMHAPADSILEQACELAPVNESRVGRIATRVLVEYLHRSGRTTEAERRLVRAIDTLTSSRMTPESASDVAGLYFLQAELAHNAAVCEAAVANGVALFNDVIIPGLQKTNSAAAQAAGARVARTELIMAMRLVRSNRSSPAIINYARSAIRHDPSLTQAHELLVSTYVSRGDENAARAACRAAEAAGVSSRTIQATSASLTADQDPAHAVRALSAILQTTPGDASALVCLYETARRGGMVGDVRPHLDAAASAVAGTQTTTHSGSDPRTVIMAARRRVGADLSSMDHAHLALAPHLVRVSADVDALTRRTGAAVRKLLSLRGTDEAEGAYAALIRLYLNPRLDATFGKPQLGNLGGGAKLLDQIKTNAVGEISITKARDRANAGSALPSVSGTEPGSDTTSTESAPSTARVGSGRPASRSARKRPFSGSTGEEPLQTAERLLQREQPYLRPTSRMHNITQAISLHHELERAYPASPEVLSCAGYILVVLYEEVKSQWQEARGEARVAMLRLKDDVKGLLTNMLQILKKSSAPECMYAQAVLHVHLKELSPARSVLKSLVSSGDTSHYMVSPLLLLAELYAANGKYDVAREYTDKVRTIDQSRVALWDLVGSIDEREGAYAEAVAAYRRGWVLSDHNDANCGFKLAFNLLKSQHYAEATEVAARLLTILPPDAGAARAEIERELLGRSAERMLI